MLDNVRKTYSRTQQSLNRANEELTSNKAYIIPRIKEIEKYQKELFDELTKIKSDGELLPSMFRAEAQFRNKCKDDAETAKSEMDKAVKNATRLHQEKRDLKHELERKERLALQAIAARQSMKDSLQE